MCIDTRRASRLSLVAALLALPLMASAAEDRGESVLALEDAVIELAAGRVDEVLAAVADSTRALGDAYARLAAAQDQRAAPDAQHWRDLSTTQGRTTGFQTWPGDLKTPPAFQAPYAAFYSYNGETLSDAAVRHLHLFEQLRPTFRTAYESFPFSWVYMTTEDETMMIYPYLPIDEAVNNNVPTDTVYYKAADFDDRAVGWTLPYLDLVGAGMMITASYPVYDGNSLLGVMSRDITLKQLSNAVVSQLATADGSVALIVDGRGLAIDASDTELAAEIDDVNTNAGSAALYYRTEDGLKTIGADRAISSRSATIVAVVEQVLAQADSSDDTVRFVTDGRRVLAKRIERTGWFVILVVPEAG